MLLRIIPGRTAIVALAASSVAALLALLMGVAVTVASLVATTVLLALFTVATWDYFSSLHAWRRSSPTMTRRLPAAFAIGVKRPVHLTIDTGGTETWRCRLCDHADATLLTDGMPVELTLCGGTRVEATYTVIPTMRGKE